MEFCSGKPDNPAASVMDYCTGVLMGVFRTVIRGLSYLLVCVLLLVCELRFFSLNLPGCIRNVHFQKYVFGLMH